MVALVTEGVVALGPYNHGYLGETVVDCLWEAQSLPCCWLVDLELCEAVTVINFQKYVPETR